VLEQATAVVTSMGDHAVKQWDQFSRAVDPVLTQLGQFGKGFGEEAVGLAKGLWEVSQVRAVTDPVGWLNSMGEMTKGIAPLIRAWPRAQLAGWELHLTGEGEETAALKQLAAGDATIVFHAP